MELRFKMKELNQLKKDRQLQPHGMVQKFVDNECIRLMDPYTPYLGGALKQSALWGTDIGSGKIEQYAPYARYQYYGKLMVSSITGSSWARMGEKKVLTATDLEYNKSKNPKAGRLWFERMKADKKEQILRGAQQIADRGM